jgi:Kef-type K+ transport system membrane component KefB
MCSSFILLLVLFSSLEVEALSDFPRYSRSPEKAANPDNNFSPAFFEKTIAAQFEKALAKEFRNDDDELGKGVASERAGRSFNQTISSRGGTLETVVRVSHEARLHKTVSAEDEQSATGRIDKEGEIGAKKLSLTYYSPLQSILRCTDKVKRMINAAKEEEGDVARLIDSSDNEFVISNPKSGTMELQQDLRLISDLVIVMCSATLGGIVFAMLNQPLITGYLLSGSLIGPGGFGLVVELVQVETLAQLGVVFLLFALGIEFSPSKLRHVQGVALLGGCTEILLAMLFCGVISDFSGAPCKEGLFIGAFLSMSSTTVVIKCLMERNEMTSLPGQIAIGTLILQDCTIGLLFALLPILGGNNSISEGIISLIRTAVIMIMFSFLCFMLSRSCVSQVFGLVLHHGGELFQSTSIAYCLAISWLSDHLGLSLELGAFIAGLLVSSSPFSDKMLQNIEPVRNFFAALFLTSIGMIMNPFFLWVHLDVLFATLLIVVVFKCTLITLVVRAFGFSLRTSFTVGISLAQVGEFSFVLLSRASSVGLVHRKLYLLLLGTTALSLVVAPTLFKLKHYIIKFASILRWIKSEDTF